MVKPPTCEIIAGSYEEFLVGYNYSSKESTLTQSFAAHDHSASIRCVALSGHYVASGGADDRIFIYDMKLRKEHCSLNHHNATINCVEFTENHSHLISGSSDGVLAIVRVGNWQLEKLWEKAHKGAAVLDIAIHSSGKLALTLGADCSLCTWNLVKGRQAYIINLKGKCKDARRIEKIVWNPDGVRFILYGGMFTEIWSIEKGGFLEQIEHKEKVTSCIWRNESKIIVGYENGNISVIDTEDNNNTMTLKAHEGRVKALAMHKKSLISVSSNGQIKVWNKQYEEVASAASGCRLTCLCVMPPIKTKNEEANMEETSVIESTENNEPLKQTKTRAKVVEIVEEDDEVQVVETSKKKRKKQNNVSFEEVIEKKKKKKKQKDNSVSN